MRTITLKPIIIFVCSMVCALYLWAHQPPATAREPSSPTPATPHLPQPPHLSISPSPNNPMDTTPHLLLGDHRDGVVSAALSPDGRLATGETDGMARIWDAQGRLLMTLKASDHEYAAVIVVFSPDGTMLGTCDEVGTKTGTVRIWDSQGRLLTENQGRDIAFSPNSALAAVLDQTVKLWNTQTRQWQEFRNPDEDEIPLRLEFSPDSSRLVTYNVYSIKLWTTQGQLLADRHWTQKR